MSWTEALTAVRAGLRARSSVTVRRPSSPSPTWARWASCRARRSTAGCSTPSARPMDGTICFSAGVGVGAHLPQRLAGAGHRDRGRGRAVGRGGPTWSPPTSTSGPTPAGPEAGRDHRLHRPRPDQDGASGRHPPRPGPAVTAPSHSGCSTSSSPRGWRTPSSSPSGPSARTSSGHAPWSGRWRAPPEPRACPPTPSRTSPAGWRRPGRPSSNSDRVPSATPTPARRSGPSSASPPSPARGATRAAARTSTAPGPSLDRSGWSGRPPPRRRPAPGRQPGAARRALAGTYDDGGPIAALASPTPTPRS